MPKEPLVSPMSLTHLVVVVSRKEEAEKMKIRILGANILALVSDSIKSSNTHKGAIVIGLASGNTIGGAMSFAGMDANKDENKVAMVFITENAPYRATNYAHLRRVWNTKLPITPPTCDTICVLTLPCHCGGKCSIHGHQISI